MMRGAAGRLWSIRATKCASDSCLRTLIREMSTRFTVLPIDPTSQPGSGSPPSVDPVKLWSTAPTGSKPAKVGTTRVFYNTPPSQPGNTDATAVVSLGEGFDKKTNDARRELVRKAIGSGIKQIRELGDGKKHVVVDAARDAHAAGLPNPGFCNDDTYSTTAVATHLAKYKFTLKTSPPSPYKIGEGQAVHEEFSFEPLQDSKEWETGVVYANAQNFARTVPSFIPSRPKAIR